jgi:hypothetical protein
MYVGAGGGPLSAFNFTPGTATSAGSIATTPSMSTTVTFLGAYANGGAQPVFSANGPDATATNAICWALKLTAGTAVLDAFDANNLANMLYTNVTNSSRDVASGEVKFSLPMVANGRVYVPGQTFVAVYGLLPQ